MQELIIPGIASSPGYVVIVLGLWDAQRRWRLAVSEKSIVSIGELSRCRAPDATPLRPPCERWPRYRLPSQGNLFYSNVTMREGLSNTSSISGRRCIPCILVWGRRWRAASPRCSWQRFPLCQHCSQLLSFDSKWWFPWSQHCLTKSFIDLNDSSVYLTWLNRRTMQLSETTLPKSRVGGNCGGTQQTLPTFMAPSQVSALRYLQFHPGDLHSWNEPHLPSFRPTFKLQSPLGALCIGP